MIKHIKKIRDSEKRVCKKTATFNKVVAELTGDKPNKHITSLTFQSFVLEEKESDEFIRLLKTDVGNQLTELNFYQVDLTDNKSLKLLHDLSDIFTIKTLSINECAVNKDTISLIAQIIENTGLEKLDLVFSGIDSEQAAIIAASLQDNITIKNLSLNGNMIDDACLSAWDKTFNKNTILEEICLSLNNFTLEGVNILINLLENNNRLIFLDLTIQDYVLNILNDYAEREIPQGIISYELSSLVDNYTIQELRLSLASKENETFLAQIIQRNKTNYEKIRFNRTKQASIIEEVINESDEPQKIEISKLEGKFKSSYDPKFLFASSTTIISDQPQPVEVENNKRYVMI